MHQMLPRLNPQGSDFPIIRRAALDTLQVNLGYRCNQSCLHCHVNAGPTRDEMMDADNIAAVLAFLRDSAVRRLDLTGGAPELNPHFRELVRAARALGVQVIDRCNLTILGEPGQADLAEFLAGQGVEIVASLPCYEQDNVDGQRGKGVFDGSIEGLRRLNALGYGQPDSGLLLNLMYNPAGAFLPPAQQSLEQAYKRELATLHGVVFNHLYSLVNMPIQRFGSTLVSKGLFDDYMQLLRDAHQADNLPQVMCRSLISVDWQGQVYDCDFNQVLGIPLAAGPRRHLRELTAAALPGMPIAVADHCYGCTAGQGSSCGGAFS